MRISILFLTAAILLCCIVQEIGAGHIEIMVVDTTASKTLLQQRIDTGGRFALHYRHSVEKTLVEEIYEVSDQAEIFLVETTVRSSGYGLPECAPGDDCITDGGRVTFRGLRYPVANLVMRVSYLNDMWLIFEKEKVNLKQRAAGGNRIVVRARPITGN